MQFNKNFARELSWNQWTHWPGSTPSRDVYGDAHVWVRGVEWVLAKKQCYLDFPFTQSVPCAFLSITHFTLQILWFWTIVPLVRGTYKSVKYNWVVKYISFCILCLKSDMENIWNISNSNVLSLNLKKWCIICPSSFIFVFSLQEKLLWWKLGQL